MCHYISLMRSVCELCWLSVEGLRGSKYKTQQRPIGLVQLSGRSMSPPWKGTCGPRNEPMSPGSLHDLNFWGSELMGVGPCCVPSAHQSLGTQQKARLEFHKTHVLPAAPLLVFTNSLISQEEFEEPLTAVPKGSPWVRVVWDCTAQSLSQITPKRAQLLYWLVVYPATTSSHWGREGRKCIWAFLALADADSPWQSGWNGRNYFVVLAFEC